MAKARAFGGQRSMSPRERSELFVNRRNKQQILSFTDLEPAVLITALNVAMANQTTLSFAPAQGGIGVTVRVYRGEYADTEFAGSVEELGELLELIVQGLYEGGEDPIEVTKMVLNSRTTSK